ncbi:hypothetical protein SAMN05428983_0863 [Agrobacterium fabrum]|uniref:Uncharacterized protein n=1 Tax=Agrobacterium fabrum TaxID=1176649 RepID=A0A7Z7BHJ6_9HYPH|nr:hypothetical protein [Agrobacterium fabrum]SDJ25927.1 hypothetical protein SAMN05428983_0863 [Agrobacterium fabrum]
MFLRSTLVILLALNVTAYAAEIDRKQEEQIKQAVKGVLKDPDSAQFKDFQRGRHRGYASEDRDAASYVCGFVNAKNSLGGYTGYAPFSYDTRSGAVEIYRVNGFGAWQGKTGNCDYTLGLL